jgi:hypothetical protein
MMQWRMPNGVYIESNANNHAAHAEIGSQMDREKRNPRLDGVSALLVVSFPCEAPSAVTCVGLCCLLRTSKSSVRFFVRLRMEFLKLAEVSLRLLLQHPSLARTRHCRSGFGFRSHDRHRHCRSDIDLDVAMGVAFFSSPLNNWMLGIEFP